MRSAMVWAFRVAWVALAFTMAPAIGQALDGRMRSVQLVGTVGAWCGWAPVLLAALVPSTVSLTLVRTVAPGSMVVAAVAWLAGAEADAGTLALATAGLATVLAFGADLGQTFVQQSAYGDEQRFPLRPPAPLSLVVVGTWLLLAAGLVAGPLLLAAHQWVGAVVNIVATALAALLPRRYHRLSRRWFVLVPAGLVVHDHVVLAETVMVGRTDVTGASLALEGTEALSLTGLALGPAVEVRLREATTVVFAAAPRGSTRAVHARSFLVAPTRPGRVLRALASAGVAVG